MPPYKNNISIASYVMVFILLIDQASKSWFLNQTLDPRVVFEIMPLLNFRLSWNTGITFGLLRHDQSWMVYFLISMAMLIIFFLFRWLRQASTLWAVLGLGLIMGGAISNVLDRLRFGAVVDFIDFHIGAWHWYTFNLADSAIVGGIIFLMLDSFVLNRREQKIAKEEKDDHNNA
ncbi:MAG: signal peptidase II [Alphaproteobacteria bacterium]|nr:signal peptidase II [Alphaproteobacteria bacterium]